MHPSKCLFVPSFRIGADSPNRTITMLGSDHSGRIEYRLNSYGFRSEDFRPDAKAHIFVFGCSYTLGVGLAESDTWPAIFRRKYCDHRARRLETVGLMNFGLAAASNQEITYTTLLQCRAVLPDVAVVQFTHCDRALMAFGDKLLPVGPWSVGQAWLNTEQRDAIADYYRNYRDAQGALELLMQMLTVQSWFVAHSIEYLLVVTSLPLKLHAPVRALMRNLDRARTIWLPKEFCRMEKNGKMVLADQPLAADGQHPGATVHHAVASLVWERYRKNVTTPRCGVRQA